jgi:hypothetical protein
MEMAQRPSHLPIQIEQTPLMSPPSRSERPATFHPDPIWSTTAWAAARVSWRSGLMIAWDLLIELASS